MIRPAQAGLLLDDAGNDRRELPVPGSIPHRLEIGLDGPEFERALKKRVTEERTAFADLIRASIAQLRQLNDVISNS